MAEYAKAKAPAQAGRQRWSYRYSVPHWLMDSCLCPTPTQPTHDAVIALATAVVACSSVCVCVRVDDYFELK